MIDQVVFDFAPISLAAIVLAAGLDFWLTRVGAVAAKRVEHVYAGEGSYELNPRFEAVIDSGARFSWPFARSIILLVVLLALLRYVPFWSSYPPGIFSAIVGGMLLLQLPTLMSHATNLQSFARMVDPTAVSGHIRFSRWFLYAQSAHYYYRFAALWALLWLPSQQAWFLGGAAACFLIGRQMDVRSRSARAATTAAPATPAPTEAGAVGSEG